MHMFLAYSICQVYLSMNKIISRVSMKIICISEHNYIKLYLMILLYYACVSVFPCIHSISICLSVSAATYRLLCMTLSEYDWYNIVSLPRSSILRVWIWNWRGEEEEERSPTTISPLICINISSEPPDSSLLIGFQIRLVIEREGTRKEERRAKV